jgi:prepilin-type N-terminal cleavage/methylation domain-containing protein
MKMNLRKQLGFTLLEFIIVAAVLVVLVAIYLPKLMRPQSRGAYSFWVTTTWQSAA